MLYLHRNQKQKMKAPRKNIKLTANYTLTNNITGEKQGYFAGKNIKGLTEGKIRETINNGLRHGSSVMVMIDRTVIVSDRKGRIHFTFQY